MIAGATLARAEKLMAYRVPNEVMPVLEPLNMPTDVDAWSL
jgi:hypothetical protein